MAEVDVVRVQVQVGALLGEEGLVELLDAGLRSDIVGEGVEEV